MALLRRAMALGMPGGMGLGLDPGAGGGPGMNFGLGSMGNVRAMRDDMGGFAPPPTTPPFNPQPMPQTGGLGGFDTSAYAAASPLAQAFAANPGFQQQLAGIMSGQGAGMQPVQFNPMPAPMPGARNPRFG